MLTSWPKPNYFINLCDFVLNIQTRNRILNITIWFLEFVKFQLFGLRMNPDFVKHIIYIIKSAFNTNALLHNILIIYKIIMILCPDIWTQYSKNDIAVFIIVQPVEINSKCSRLNCSSIIGTNYLLFFRNPFPVWYLPFFYFSFVVFINILICKFYLVIFISL